MAAANSSAADASVALQHLQQQVHAVQAGHSRLDETLQHIKQRQQEQEQQIEQQRQQQQQQWAGASQGGGSGEEQLQQQLQGALQELDSLSLAAAELPAVQQQLAAVAEQQAQQARSSQDLVQSGGWPAGLSRALLGGNGGVQSCKCCVSAPAASTLFLHGSSCMHVSTRQPCFDLGTEQAIPQHAPIMHSTAAAMLPPLLLLPSVLQ